MNGSRVMVIDDGPFDQALIRSAFRQVGSVAEVDLVPEVAVAIRLLQTCRAPDVLIVDLNLGAESGLELVEWLRRSDELRGLPAIVMSGSHEPDDVSAAYRAGANAFVTKPESLEDLHSLVFSLDTFWLRTAKLPRFAAPVSSG